MERAKIVNAVVSPKVVLSKGDYIKYLLEQIHERNQSLQNALENDKFHVVGREAGIIDEHVTDLRVLLDI